MSLSLGINNEQGTSAALGATCPLWYVPLVAAVATEKSNYIGRGLTRIFRI